MPIFRAGALVLALTLASCGGAARGRDGTPAPGPSPADDPLYLVESLDGVDGCDLLTRAEIGRAVGGAVSAGTGDDAGNCTWEVGPDPAVAGSGAGVVAVGGAPHRPTEAGVADTYAAMRRRLGTDALDVPGVGRAAHYVGGTGGFAPGTVTFHTGEDIVWVQASVEPVRPGTREDVIDLAGAVAGRL